MAEKKINNVRVINKHDTEANWLKATNFIPKQGELIVYDKDSTYNYERFKIGDGSTVVSSLPFADANKVDKVDGKGLSTNDYTNEENYCDYCHRKSMNWSIAPWFAESLADAILENKEFFVFSKPSESASCVIFFVLNNPIIHLFMQK